MESTERHKLPYLAADQAQKHVTVNEAVRLLDALISASAISRRQDVEPADPLPGDGYILTAAASGPNWDSLSADDLVVFQDGTWTRIPPRTGLTVFIIDEGAGIVWTGTSWSAIQGGLSGPSDRLGINAAADDTNRLLVKSDAVLLSHDDVTPGSGDIRQFVNKRDRSSTASLIFQTGYEARAEVGLSGTDGFRIAVSADGITFKDAIVIDRITGAVSFPNTPLVYGQADALPPRNETVTGEVVIGLLGQSNMVGTDQFDGGPGYPSGTLEYNQSNQFVAAISPLDHENEEPGTMGLSLEFAIAVREVYPNVTLIFVPCAQGGTGLIPPNGSWAPGGPLREKAITRINAALAARPDAVFGGFLWQQGERDTASPTTAAAYADGVDALIADLRSRVTGAAGAPFVAGRFSDIFLAGDPDHLTVERAIAGIPGRVPNTAAVPAFDLSMLDDDLHFDAPALRTLGRRHAIHLLSLNPPAFGLAQAVSGGGDDGGEGPSDPPDPPDPGQGITPETGAVAHWVFGDDNTGFEDLVADRTLSPTGWTNEDGYVTIPAGNRQGVSTGLPETATLTMAVVFRRTGGQSFIAGTLLPPDQSATDGFSIFLGAAGELRMRAQVGDGFTTVKSSTSTTDFEFAAASVSSTARRYLTGNGGSATLFQNDNTGSWVPSSRDIPIGTVAWDSPFEAALDIAEVIIFNDDLTQAELEALYARSVARMAARGITVV